MVAERTAVPAHLDAEAADFMMVGGIEQARQHNQHGGHVVHQTTSERMLRYDDPIARVCFDCLVLATPEYGAGRPTGSTICSFPWRNRPR
jgi:hypothetical protein